MAGERAEGSKPPGEGGIASELVAAGFLDAVEVGRGGAGIVYRCHQTSLARSVAIKVLMSDFDQDSRERFLREGLAMGKLSGHPNIENILQVGVTETNRPYIVMPYHQAGSLAQRLHRVGRTAWPDALRIAVKLCGALETAHLTGTLHRDIKPANVLVNDYGEPQLSDFGIARILGGYETATGFFTGTIAFTAPEVLAGSPPTVVSDVYSLGATIYALIAGTAAHERKSDEEDLIAHYLRISSTPVPDMRPQGIPASVCAAIEKAMSLDPTERHASAADFGREMQSAQRHNGLMADSMVLSETNGEPGQAAGTSAIRFATVSQTDLSEAASIALGGPPGPTPPTPVSNLPGPPAPIPPSPGWPIPPGPRGPIPPGAHGPPIPESDGPTSITRKTRNRRPLLFAAAAAVVALLLVVSGIYFISSRDNGNGGSTGSASQPTTQTQAGWKPITNARVAREAAATTQADGTIWIFG
ncbi:MAG: hypothetical protein QOI90_133, partial [Mycobacterium sp.]|nr:hypothetical protein [Mycobacterium sp.]